MTGKSGQLTALFGLEEMWTNDKQSGVFMQRATSADAGRERGGTRLFSLERDSKNHIKEASLGWALLQDSLSHAPWTWTFFSPLLFCPGTKFSLAPRCSNPHRAVRADVRLCGEACATQAANRSSRCGLLALSRITVLDAY